MLAEDVEHRENRQYGYQCQQRAAVPHMTRASMEIPVALEREPIGKTVGHQPLYSVAAPSLLLSCVRRQALREASLGCAK
jgi:hypothetical protein